jgi:hypothetical protein
MRRGYFELRAPLYNFIKIHRTLRVTPAIAAGVTHGLVRYRAVPRTNRTPALSSRGYPPKSARVEVDQHCYVSTIYLYILKVTHDVFVAFGL